MKDISPRALTSLLETMYCLSGFTERIGQRDAFFRRPSPLTLFRQGKGEGCAGETGESRPDTRFFAFDRRGFSSFISLNSPAVNGTALFHS